MLDTIKLVLHASQFGVVDLMDGKTASLGMDFPTFH